MKIVCAGDCGVDLYLPSQKYYPGGITANFTKQARRCFGDDDQIYIISAIGNDGEAAQLAYNSTNLPGIECHIPLLEGKTPVQYIEVKEDGEKNFVNYERGVLKDFILQPDQIEVIRKADLIVTPVYKQIHNVFDVIMSTPHPGKVAVDFSDFASHPDFNLLNKYIKKIDICFFGLESHQHNLIDHISSIAKASNKLMVITLGAEGSLAIKAENTYFCSAIKVEKIVDTTGAGDAFAAGFLASYSKGGSTDNALLAGANIGAETIQHLGAVPPPH